MKATLIRLTSDNNQTLGLLVFTELDEKKMECRTMELPWKDNQPNISCIPEGKYLVKKHTSPTFGRCFEVLDVPKRTHILLHKGNYNRNTKGCILPGNRFKDIDNDGLKDVTSSKVTLDQMLLIAPDEFTLTIV